MIQIISDLRKAFLPSGDDDNDDEDDDEDEDVPGCECSVRRDEHSA